MNTDNVELQKLVDKARETGKICTSEISKVIDLDSDEFDNLYRWIEENNIDYRDDLSEQDALELEGLSDFDSDPDFDEEEDLDEGEDDDFLEIMKNNPDFVEFSKEVDNDLIKTKDIEDLVSNNSTFYADDPVRMYLKEIGQIPLLKLQQETEYSKAVQNGIAAQEALDAYHAGKKKLSEEEVERLENYVAEGDQARDILTESNLRLVVSIAKKFTNKGLEFQDLIQEGNMGLMKAVRKFDPDKGFKFSTYATWWIKQSITRAIADQARTIRIPVHMVETINRMSRIQRRLTQELHRDPTPQEIAKEMDKSVEYVIKIQKISVEPVSIDGPVGEEDDSTVGDFVPDTETLNPLDYTMREKAKELLDMMLKELTDKEERIIRLKYGLDDGKSRTLDVVGKEFGVTRERIRQIEAKALRKLRAPARKRFLICLKNYMMNQ